VEEQFYLLCPLVLARASAWLRLGLVVALMALGIVVRARLAAAGVHDVTLQYNSLAHLDTLFSGVLLALLLSRYPPGARVDRLAGWWQWLLLPALVFVFTREDLAHGAPWRRTWDFVAIWLGSVGLVALAVVRRGWFARALANARLVWLGKISYGLYMYHEVALWIRAALNRHLPWFPNQENLLAILAFALTIGMAAASYYGYERYFLRLKTRWTRVASRPV
jgi:peptidoglycan/LPS O-acetylase OafA/YrhL